MPIVVKKKKCVVKTVVFTAFSESANGLALRGLTFSLHLIPKLLLLLFFLGG